MKNFIFILTVTIFVSCSSRNNELNNFLVATNIQTQVILESEANNRWTDFMRAITENEHRVKPYKVKADTLEFLYNEFVDTKNKFINKTEQSFDISRINQFKTSSYLNDEIIEAAQNLYFYNLKLTEKTEHLNQRITEIFDIEYYKNKNLSLVDIELLQISLLNITNITLEYIFSKIDAGNFRFNVFKPIVIPEKYWLKTGENYKATISYCFMDTTRNPKGVIDNDSLIFEQGIAKYSITPTEIGEYHKKGKLLIESPSTGEIMEFPFNIDFKVVK